MIKEEVFTSFYEGDQLTAVLSQNGSAHFFKVKKMLKDDVSALLQSFNPKDTK